MNQIERPDRRGKTGSFSNLFRRDGPQDPVVTRSFYDLDEGFESGGSFTWDLTFALQKAGHRGGWIIDEVIVKHHEIYSEMGSGADGTEARLSNRDETWHFWQAWAIPGGAAHPSRKVGQVDRHYRFSGRSFINAPCQGKITIHSTALFIPGKEQPFPFTKVPYYDLGTFANCSLEKPAAYEKWSAELEKRGSSGTSSELTVEWLAADVVLTPNESFFIIPPEAPARVDSVGGIVVGATMPQVNSIQLSSLDRGQRWTLVRSADPSIVIGGPIIGGQTIQEMDDTAAINQLDDIIVRDIAMNGVQVGHRRLGERNVGTTAAMRAATGNNTFMAVKWKRQTASVGATGTFTTQPRIDASVRN